MRHSPEKETKCGSIKCPNPWSSSADTPRCMSRLRKEHDVRAQSMEGLCLNNQLVRRGI
jgi:hypothetical protein